MRNLSISLLAIFFLASCAQHQEGTDTEVATDEETDVIELAPEIEKATAVLNPTNGNNAAGVVTFTVTEQGIRVEATVTGLEPDTRHGFHVHQFGDCRAPDATSAGGHFNPSDGEHGAPSDDIRHMGDLGNIPANAQGTASVDFLDEHLELNGENSIIGRSVIVHADEDDFVSQPSGAAGPRVACGAIGIANPDVTIDDYQFNGLTED